MFSKSKLSHVFPREGAVVLQTQWLGHTLITMRNAVVDSDASITLHYSQLQRFGH